MRATCRLLSVVLLSLPACMGEYPEEGTDTEVWSLPGEDFSTGPDDDAADAGLTTGSTPSPEPNGSTMAADDSGGDTDAPDPDPTAVGTSGDASEDDGPTGPGFCTHTCAADSDCIATESLGPMICKDAGSCSHDCSSDDDCTFMINGPLWEASVPCSAGGNECDVFGPYYACMEGPNGLGGCVLEATYGCDMGFAPWAATDIDGNPTEVCAFLAACLPDSGLCTLACETDADCLVP